MKQSRTERIFGRYRLIAALIGGQAQAMAYLAKARQGSGIIARASADTVEQALQDLADQLTQRDSAARAVRRLEPRVPLHVPSAQEYTETLAILAPNDKLWAMLRTHAIAGPKGLTAGALANAAGWPDFSSANLHYGMLAKAIADDLHIDLTLSAPKADAAARAHAATFALATGDASGPDGTFLWVMHPELVQAVMGRS